MNTIDAAYYAKLAPVIYLPSEFTPENHGRATRIIRILRDMSQVTYAIATIDPCAGTGIQKVQIMPITFIGPFRVGDFNWMITRPEYADVLFLFNDNEAQFAAFVNSIGQLNRPMIACSAGGGNAIIRPYQCLDPPRAAGIPTGDASGGYQKLARHKPVIDAAFVYIRELLRLGQYKRVAYSAGHDGRTLGTAIFSPSAEIREYIVSQIESLAQ